MLRNDNITPLKKNGFHSVVDIFHAFLTAHTGMARPCPRSLFTALEAAWECMGAAPLTLPQLTRKLSTIPLVPEPQPFAL